MALLPKRKVIPFNRRASHARHPRWSVAFQRLEARVVAVEGRLDHLDRRFSGLTVATRLRMAILVSLLVHAFIIFGMAFKAAKPWLPKHASESMDVVLVNAKSDIRPLRANAYAQYDLDGGGNTEAKRRARTPLPVTQPAKQRREITLARRRVKQLEREAKRLLAQTRAAPVAVPSAPPHPAPQPTADRAPNLANLMQRRLEIARLEAEISRDWSSYERRPRRRFIGARTREFRFARYVEDWRHKIERIGELNYPETARDQGLYGSLIVTVSIKADGSLAGVQIDRSSGNRLLDEAAVRIVKLAAPFAPFPPNIRKDTDILSITRTWTFTRADRFSSE